MKVALVHDYIKEYGGAERVLEALTEVFPQSPIYTAFCQKDSTAYEHFKNKKIITSWVQNIPFFASKLHSPLRFLAPLIWGSFEKEFSQYDVVISSASWYVTKGFGSRTFHSHPELVSGSKSPRAEMPKQVRHDTVQIEKFTMPRDALDYLLENLKGGEVVLFKGARFLEGVIEHLLLDKNDVKKLCRREKVWEKRRNQWGL